MPSPFTHEARSTFSGEAYALRVHANRPRLSISSGNLFQIMPDHEDVKKRCRRKDLAKVFWHTLYKLKRIGACRSTGWRESRIPKDAQKSL